MATTILHHLWECGSTPREPFFLLCAVCAARIRERDPEDAGATIFGACPGHRA